MKRPFLVIALFAALIAGAPSAHASLIATFSGTFPVAGTAVGPLDKFTGPGTLTSVDFLFTTSGSGTLTITDGPGNPDQTLDLHFGAAITLLDASLNPLVTTLPLSTLPGVSIPGDGTPVVFTLTANNLMTTATLSNPALLSQFVGPGSINLELDAEGQASTSPGLAVPFTVLGSGEAHGTVEVIYHASQVPEPATLSLIGGALILLCRATWRFRPKDAARTQPAEECPQSPQETA